MLSKKKLSLKEFNASFGVNAQSADPVGGTNSPAGISPSPGDSGGKPSVSPSELKLQAIAELVKGLTDEEKQKAIDSMSALADLPVGGDVEGKSAEEKTGMMRGVHGVKMDSELKGEAFDFNFDKKDKDDDKDDEKEDKEDDKKDNKDDDEKEEEEEDDDDKKDDEEKNESKSFELEAGDINVTEDIAAIFSGSELTEDFKTKATEIFEAVVISKVNEQLAYIQEAVEADIKARATDKLKKIAEALDTYLGYVVEQWLEENQVAVESGLQKEIVEEFIGGLHTLFTEHHLSVPTEKEDVVEKLVLRTTELEEALNVEVKRNAEQKQAIDEMYRSQAIKDGVAGLTTTQAVKLTTIAEGLSFGSAAEFSTKVKELRESYFPTEAPKQGARTLEENNVIELTEAEDAPTGPMGRYAMRITQDVKN